MCVCRFACKEEVVKVIEELLDQRVGRSVGGSKGLNGLRTGRLSWIGFKVLMQLTNCEGVFQLQLRLLVGGP